MLQSWDMGQIILLPLRRKACCGFFQQESGSEPAILGTRGQHANHQTTEAADSNPQSQHVSGRKAHALDRAANGVGKCCYEAGGQGRGVTSSTLVHVAFGTHYVTWSFST
jgi:hypothetical protein